MRLRTIIGALSFGTLVVIPSFAEASSHREAPFITKNPKVDNTDVYAFESYDPARTGMVTLIADFQPFQDAYGGPNYFAMDPNALYEISIDNDGDGVEDLTFQFQFQTKLGGTANAGAALMIGPAGAQKSVAVPFYNVGLIPDTAIDGNSTALNVLETYSVGLVRGPRRGSAPSMLSNAVTGKVFEKPADNVGAKSFGAISNSLPAPLTPSTYSTYASKFIYPNVAFPGCTATDAASAQIFVGQRAEPFAVNLGPTFDLIDAPASVVTNGLATAPGTTGALGGGGYGDVPNPLAAKNITTIAIEVPRDCIVKSAAQPVIGVWSTASVRQARVINPAASFTEPSQEGGAWTQVSRLGNPLVNEVVIGLPDKDKWNSSEPKDDVTNFGTYVEYPTLPAVIDVVFGTDFQPTTFPRTDLVGAFLLGLTGVNSFPAGTGSAAVVPAEYIHLNTNTEALAGQPPTPAGSQNRLGAALCVTEGALNPASLSPYAPLTSCDPFGFPNGRRPVDDVVDLALDVVEGYLLPSGNPAYNNASNTPVFFTDGVDQGAIVFDSHFPYILTPNQGANGNGT
jgi:hypothetical protein